MKKLYATLATSSVVLLLSACQTSPQAYNGHTGYQVEQRTSQDAIINYTLAAKANANSNTAKLQNACKKVLGSQQDYKIEILSNSEIINPANTPSSYGIGIGQSKTSFELAQINNTTDQSTAARTALNTHPQTLNVIRYRCTA
ncbi:hypothetical protein [Acinetobacter rathckeae]|uniref:hypothetical protein n=1 Tax=Acinetobacter rathckeae TaxID=2605272 RepID=UPI0018A2C69A|nr:hypothetical protein [Acinetobacter rathckeae]MBF7687032.1 hypothetical protein [Acinetobacter rathckeae]MBF7694564.1 hypothetical protein [Acinetobacter rathckeae]